MNRTGKRTVSLAVIAGAIAPIAAVAWFGLLAPRSGGGLDVVGVLPRCGIGGR